MGRIDRARQSILRHHSEFLRLRFGEGGIGSNQGDGRVLGHGALREGRKRGGRHLRGKAKAAEFTIELKRTGPEMRPIAHHNAAARVHRDHSAHRVPVAGQRRKLSQGRPCG